MENEYSIIMYRNCKIVGNDSARLGKRHDVCWNAAVTAEAHRGEDAAVVADADPRVLRINETDSTKPTSETDRAGFLAGSVSARQYLDDERKKTIEEECRDEESEEIDFDGE